MASDDEILSQPPPLPAAAQKKRSFWRSPLGILTVLGLCFFALILAAFAALGFAMQFGYLPDSAAVSGDRLKSHVVETLRGADILEPGEQVGYYYAGGLFSYLEDGNLFTDKRVISYWKEEGELQIASATFAEIEDISVEWSDSLLNDTEITATLFDGGEVFLVVSKESGGDRKFHEELLRRWEKNR